LANSTCFIKSFQTWLSKDADSGWLGIQVFFYHSDLKKQLICEAGICFAGFSLWQGSLHCGTFNHEV
jgi:hypothetical protein